MERGDRHADDADVRKQLVDLVGTARLGQVQGETSILLLRAIAQALGNTMAAPVFQPGQFGIEGANQVRLQGILADPAENTPEKQAARDRVLAVQTAGQLAKLLVSTADQNVRDAIEGTQALAPGTVGDFAAFKTVMQAIVDKFKHPDIVSPVLGFVHGGTLDDRGGVFRRRGHRRALRMTRSSRSSSTRRLNSLQ